MYQWSKKIALIHGSTFHCAGLIFFLFRHGCVLERPGAERTFCISSSRALYCKSCEFRIGDDLKAKGQKSGFLIAAGARPNADPNQTDAYFASTSRTLDELEIYSPKGNIRRYDLDQR